MADDNSTTDGDGAGDDAPAHAKRGFTLSIHVNPDGLCTGKIGSHEVVSERNYFAAFNALKRAGVPAATERGIDLGI